MVGAIAHAVLHQFPVEQLLFHAGGFRVDQNIGCIAPCTGDFLCLLIGKINRVSKCLSLMRERFLDGKRHHDTLPDVVALFLRVL